MEYQTRRERREAERAAEQSSQLVNSQAQADEVPTFESSPEPIIESPEPVNPEQIKRPSRSDSAETESGSRPLTRRELRKLEAEGKKVDINSGRETPNQQVADRQQRAEEISAGPSEPENLHQKSMDESDEYRTDEAEQLTGKSYLYQESSNTFTLDAIPNSLATSDSESIITNTESVAVVTDSQPSFASDMDDLRFDLEDHQDTVAGKISLVDPVSARIVAEARDPEIVGPGKLVVRNRLVSVGFGVLATVLFVAAGIGLWWVLTEMDVFR